MKASELKIGNYIDLYGNVARIIPNDFTKWVNHNWEADDLRPIPLTEAWLLRFGFVKERGSYIMGVHQSRFSGLMKFKFDPLIQWVFSVGKYKDITRVKFVHELQNLYFALTGEELIIKP